MTVYQRQEASERQTPCPQKASRAIRRWRRVQRKERDQRRKASAAAARGEWERFRRLRALYFRSFDARLAAVHEANQSFPPHHRVPLRALREIAGRLDPVRGTEEAGVSRSEPKSSGEGFRVVTRFGIENKAIQIMAQRMLQPSLERRLAPNQYAVRNGGRHAACQDVSDALETRNARGDFQYHWAAELDIRDCFESFHPGEVERLLPMKRGVTRNALVGRHLNLVPHRSLRNTGDQATTTPTTPTPTTINLLPQVMGKSRLGTPQGSVTSSPICELLLAPTVTEASATAEEQHGCLFNYADNFLVLARTRKEVIAITEALGVSLRRNPAGLLRLKSPRIRRVDYGFDFLGYTFRRRMGTVTARPTREKLEEVRDRYWLKRIEHRHRGWRLPSGHLERSIRSFRAQYPLWGNAGLAWQHNLLSALDELRSCPAAAARDLGHVLSRALKIAGDNGVLSYIRVSCVLRENGRLIACTVQVAKPGADEVITVTRHGRE